MSGIRSSIAYILIRDGEATPRQLSDKLATGTTSVAVALKAMYDAGEVDRKAVWDNSSGQGGHTYSYWHKGASPALTGAPPSPVEMARYVLLDGKKVARLTDTMYEQVQRHGADNQSRLRIVGPDPATKEQRWSSRQKGIAIPLSQYIELDIILYKQMSGSEKAFGLIAPNKRTLDALLQWHPEFRLST